LPFHGRTGTASLDRVLAHLRAERLQVDWILETHAHADHLSGAPPAAALWRAHFYRSMRRLLALPPSTRLSMCHDYPPDGPAPQWETTVAAQRASNVHVRDGITEDAFVAMRTARDATLEVSTLMLPSVQVNVRAGQLPPADENGVA
jgi:ribonuclease BN (tRNA processing enzyme)